MTIIQLSSTYWVSTDDLHLHDPATKKNCTDNAFEDTSVFDWILISMDFVYSQMAE